jgi:hypothetical protein
MALPWDGDTYVMPSFSLPSVSKPDELLQTAWEYLQQFAWEHEGPVPFMYNDGDSANPAWGGKGAVTCGVGKLVEPRGAVSSVLDLFYSRAGGVSQSADLPGLQEDYDFASTHPNPKANSQALDVYARGTKYRMHINKMTTKMAEDLKLKLIAMLAVAYPNGQTVATNFDQFPSQAKIAQRPDI